jgi:cell division protein FtsA
MNKTGVVPMRKYFTAESTARAVLRDSEMESGVALIDFGGGCTSVSIYQGKIMRHFASIPFGGKNITNDIKSECQISERLAENIKLEFGACMPDKLLSLSDKILDIRGCSNESTKQLSVKYLSEIITARVEEIMMAVLYEIEQSGFADSLRSGIVVTGGCAQTANLANLIYDISGFKVRIGYPQKTFSCEGCDGLAETSAATAIGLIMASLNDPSINCATANTNEPAAETVVEEVSVVGNEDEPQGSLFKNDEEEKVKPTPKPQQPKKKKKGILKIFKNNIFDGVTATFDNIFDVLDEDKVPAAPATNDEDEEDTEEKA